MWEIDIIINYRHRKFLMYLKENITNSKYYNYKGVFAILKIGYNAILSIAIMEPAEELLQEIKVWIAECLIFSEKDQYIRSKKVLPTGEFRNSFLKALVMVGMDTDIEYTSHYIDLNQTSINLHSLFRFRLNSITNKWDNMLEQFFPQDEKLDNTKLTEILKSIIASNKKNIDVVLRKNATSYIIENNSDIYITALDEADCIANLILLSPNRITIECKDNLSADSLVLLEYLFDQQLLVT